MIRQCNRSLLLILVGLLGVEVLTTPGRAAPPQGVQPLELHLRFTPGRELLYFVTTDKVVTQEDDAKNPFRSRTQYLLRQKVQSVSPTEATLQFQFDQVRWLPSGIEEQAFDSAKPPAPQEPPLFTAARSMIGKPFVVTMNAKAEILSLRQVDLRYQSTDKNELQLVGETQLRGLLTSFYSWFPAGPVLPHESWTRDEDMDLGFLKLKRTNRVRVVGGTYSRPEIKAEIEVQELPSPGIDQAGLHIVGHLKTSVPGNGTIRFNCDEGILESIETSAGFEMTVETKELAKKRAKPKLLTQRLQATTKVELRAVDGVEAPLAN